MNVQHKLRAVTQDELMAQAKRQPGKQKSQLPFRSNGKIRGNLKKTIPKDSRNGSLAIPAVTLYLYKQKDKPDDLP
jgi:hypothetical protein